MAEALRWGHNFIVAEIRLLSRPLLSCLAGFNGAATLSLRKYMYFQPRQIRTMQLQWGRNFIVAEISQPRYSREPRRYFNGAATLSLRKSRPGPGPWLFRLPASMGPQLYRYGNLASSLSPTVKYASMGPQLYHYGNDMADDKPSLTSQVLQWGRNFIVAEMNSPPRPPPWCARCFNGAATLSLRKLASVIRRSAY